MIITTTTAIIIQYIIVIIVVFVDHSPSSSIQDISMITVVITIPFKYLIRLLWFHQQRRFLVENISILCYLFLLLL